MHRLCSTVTVSPNASCIFMDDLFDSPSNTCRCIEGKSAHDHSSESTLRVGHSVVPINKTCINTDETVSNDDGDDFFYLRTIC